MAVTEDDRTVLSFFLRNDETGGQDEDGAIGAADHADEDIAVAAVSDEDVSAAEDSDTETQDETDTEPSDVDEDEDNEENEVFWVRHIRT